MEPDAEAGARRGPRSAPARHRAARRARRTGRGRAGRRSRLDRPARRPRAGARRQDRRRCRSTASSRSIRRCRICTGSTRRSRPPSCTPRRRPIASARISTARTCSRAGSRGPAPSTPAGSTVRWSNWRRTAASIRAAAAPLASARSRRWWCAARRRCCRGRRSNCCLPARTPRPGCWTSISTPIRSWRPRFEARMRLAALGGVATSTMPHVRRGRACGRPALRACAPISPKPPARPRAFSPRPDGPRVGALGFVGWDTHINEGAASGQLANLLGRARRRAGGDRDQHGRRLARDGGRRHHRVRTHRAHQRHRRHRPWHRHRGVPRRRRAARADA